MSALLVVAAGPRSTVQDLGRRGFGHLGVPRAGAVDRASYDAANRAVGNSTGAAAIEMTLGGLTVEADGDVVVAIIGADVGTWIGDTVVTPGRAQVVRTGERLRVGRSTTGSYVYLAVRGGIDVPPVLGSRSTDTLCGIGPPVLRDGDRLSVGEDAGGAAQPVAIAALNAGPLRVRVGPHADRVAGDTFARLLSVTWTVTAAADRTALRLAGPALEARDVRMRSEGLVEGAVQLPADGQPIVFLANHPTTGGYPVIAVVDCDDIGRAAQCRPGRTLRFRAD